MKTILVWLSCLAISIGIWFLIAMLVFGPEEARCAWCPDYTCYSSSMCGNGCTCMKVGTTGAGRCVSFND